MNFKKLSKKDWISFVVVIIVVLFIIFQFNISKQKVDLIDSAVKEVKVNIVFPQKINKQTELVDVLPESNAILFVYEFSGDATAEINDITLRNDSFLSTTCQNKILRSYLDNGIDIGYSYNIVNTTKRYSIYLSKENCLK